MPAKPRVPQPACRLAIDGIVEEQGPLVRQPAPAARLARILHHSATDLWDVCTLTDTAQMWEEARAVASRILASCPTD
jgi:hypothetical protein